MKTLIPKLIPALLALFSLNVIAATTRYVNLNNPSPAPPYLDWSTAATNIQHAVDAAAAGDEIVVTNGVYQTGGKVMFGSMTNRVAVNKPLMVRSVNGPAVTVIRGYRVPGTTNGNSAVRCVYLTNGAALSGFTLTNGATRSTGDFTKEQFGGGVWCESASASVTNCALTGNSANFGGGGAYGCTLNNCTLTGNSAYSYGGGAASGTLNNCTLTGNSANQGGGTSYGTLNNCTLTGNSASSGGGSYFGALNNCIVYYNTAVFSKNYNGATLNYCCTTPLPTGGIGNFIAEPQLASASYLSTGSACLGTGSPAYAAGVDIDGESWLNPPAVGCDEYHSGSLTGAVSVALSVSFTNVATEFVVEFQANITGRVSASRWEFGDGTVVSNQPYASHSWGAAGDYPVVVRAYNESHPAGVTATMLVHVVEQVHYVALDAVGPVSPYTSWTTAATNIQDAVDAATVPGALVLVSNGVYQTGGRVVYGAMANRVAVNKLLTVRSVNGPGVTVIQGYQVPGTTNGDSAVRCVYLTNGAALAGFTLTNGATRSSGDYGGEQSGGGIWCESASGVVSNCIIIGNSANGSGGGSSSGTLNNCTLSGNSANEGGGSYSGTLNNCTLGGNSAYGYGGGAFSGTLNNCTLGGNSARSGGGSYSATLNNCTLTGNSAIFDGGGSYSGTLNNCIVYYNTASSGLNYYSSTINYCCTVPLPGGTGNFTAEPQLASLSHLSVNSSCLGAGSAAYATGVDIDGEAWANPPSIGCDEHHSGLATGAVSVAIHVDFTNLTTGFKANFIAEIGGRVSASRWEFGDGTIVSNRPYTSHSWVATGDHPVVLRAYNESHPAGLTTTTMVHVVTQPVHHVSLDSLSPSPPYSSWATAATRIQDAVDTASVAGAMVLVSNGVYQTGGCVVHGAITNRVAVNKPLTVLSVNGPAVTLIQGYQVPGTTNGDSAMRCVYLTSGAALAGFTLTNGATRSSGDNYWEKSGGGVWCASASGVVSNCIISGNSAYNSGGGSSSGTLNNCTFSGNSAYYGGGSSSGTLNNCTLSGNSARSGGGSSSGTLNNCTLSGNSANGGGGVSGGTLNNCTLARNSASSYGGGADYGALNNCVVYYNTAPSGSNHNFSTMNNSCTAPFPGGTGNFTNAPLFVDSVVGNFRLQASSPCINAGNNDSAPAGADLDGRPRIIGGTVDVGAYEFQGAGIGEFIAWLQNSGLPTDGSADYTDADGDGMNNYGEWRSDTNPTNSLSSLRMVNAANSPSGKTVTWQSVSTRSYWLERATNLGLASPFQTVATNIVGVAGVKSFTDPSATNAGPYFYRVGVQ